MLRVLIILFILSLVSSVETQDATPTSEPRTVITAENAEGVEQLLTLQGSTQWINDLEFTPNSQFLAVAETGIPYDAFRDAQGKVRIWDTQSWEEAALLSIEELSAVSLTFEANGDYVAIGYTTGEIQIWNWKLSQVNLTLTGHDTWVNALTFASGGDALMSASGAIFSTNEPGDSTVRLWLPSLVDEDKELLALVPENAKLGAGWSVGSSAVAGINAAGMTNGTVHLWGSESNRKLAILDGYAMASGILFTPDGSRILYTGRDGVRMWDIRAAVETFGYFPEYVVVAPLANDQFIFSIALSPDGTILAASYQDGSIGLWDIESGVQFVLLEGHTGRAAALAFSPDGTLLASGGADGRVRLWGVPSAFTRSPNAV